MSVTLSPALRAAVHAAWIQAAPGGDGASYCFSATTPRSDRRPTVRTLRDRLRRMCRSAGVPYCPPHGFRRFVVNHAMRNGATLADVSAFIGHETTGVTYRHYWTDPVLPEVNAVLDGDEADTRRRLKAELTAVETAIRTAEAEVEATMARAHHRRSSGPAAATTDDAWMRALEENK